MSGRIAIFGGGVGGLSAAHELICRGYEVDVYEGSQMLGGKARSQPVLDPATGGLLPGEHGFRFYPHFYRNVVDTMKRIPLNPAEWTVSRCLGGPAGDSVDDNLIDVHAGGVGRDDDRPVHRFLRRRPRDPAELMEAIQVYFWDLGIRGDDLLPVTMRLMQFYTSCDERRDDYYERMTLWEFLRADELSEDFQKYIQSTLTSMVAMDAHEGNARTLATMNFRMMIDQLRDGNDTDRIFAGPTTAMWIEPWRQCLEALGVRFHLGAALESFECDAATRRVREARVRGLPDAVHADHYVLAVPLDVAQRILSHDLAASCPQIGGLCEIDLDKTLRWMVGAQFYLRDDLPVIDGHVFYADHPWALTTISQAQFWSRPGDPPFRERYGNGVVGGILSVDISDWFAPGKHTTPKQARDCSRAEIRTEVWTALKAAINSPGAELLKDANQYGWHLDDDVLFDDVANPGGPPVENRSRLMIHPPNIWAKRPEAETGVENLVLAADYVRTATDLATMEGANEAARLAVNSILRKENRTDFAQRWDHSDLEPAFIKAAKLVDSFLYRVSSERPSAFEMAVSEFSGGRPPAERRWTFDDLRQVMGRFFW